MSRIRRRIGSIHRVCPIEIHLGDHLSLDFERLGGTRRAGQAAAHDGLPRLARATAEKQQESGEEVGKVVVAGDGAGGSVGGDLAEELHAHDGEGEEEEEDEHEDVRQRSEALYEGPDEEPNAVALAQKFGQSRGAEKT